MGWPLFPDPGQPRSPIEAEERAMGEQVVAGLSNASVSITTSFDGSEILIYGAVKREEPMPEGDLDVIVTIEAPSQPATIWQKQRRFGIWVNTESVRIGAAPSFYAVATSGPLDEILDPAWDSRFRISLPQALRAFAGTPDVVDTRPFTEAMIRLRRQNGHYRLQESSVTLVEDTLFRTDIRLPANLIEGDYKTRIFLLRDGRVIDVYRAGIEVRKVGVERWLYNLAFEQPLLYGLMSLAVAVAAGWGASAAFRRLRRS
ncbi:TIGR02186 family protein [Paracoccus sp. C2R09]|nr:TIGR02186 family protein [Paracoccus sp. C2R09]